MKNFLRRFLFENAQDTYLLGNGEKLTREHESKIEQQLVDIAWINFKFGIKSAVFRRIKHQSYLLALIRPNASRVPKPQAPDEFSLELLNSYNRMAEETGQTRLSTIIWTEIRNTDESPNSAFPAIVQFQPLKTGSGNT